MADRSAIAAAACRRGGFGAQQAARHRCSCGGGCGLARLVERLRRQGRRALCAPAVAARRRGCQCQYDPLSYARNFDLGDDADADAAHVYYSNSFSSRFVLPPSSSSSSSTAAAASAPTGLIGSRPVSVVTSH